MPPTHRPSPPIPDALEFLTKPKWLPLVLVWALIFGILGLIWFFGWLPR
jgi:hypothetical protein